MESDKSLEDWFVKTKVTRGCITPPGRTSPKPSTTLTKAGQDLAKDTTPQCVCMFWHSQQSEQSQSGDSHGLCQQCWDYYTNWEVTRKVQGQTGQSNKQVWTSAEKGWPQSFLDHSSKLQWGPWTPRPGVEVPGAAGPQNWDLPQWLGLYGLNRHLHRFLKDIQT